MDNPLLAIGPARPGPALRRGFLVAIPVGVALFLEFGLDSPTKGAIATGALLCRVRRPRRPGQGSRAPGRRRSRRWSGSPPRSGC